MIERRLGSTEIASVAAFYSPELSAELPKNQTAGDVYARLKWGLQKPKNRGMNRGNRIEPLALAYYREHIGPTWRAVPDGEWWTVPHPRNEWFTASPDAWDAPKPRILIEAKSWSDSWGRHLFGEPGTDQIATRFQYQVAWLQCCCETEEAHVIVMFGHDTIEGDEDYFQITEPAVYPVDRSIELETRLLEYGGRFIDEFVRTGWPPPVKPHSNRLAFKREFANERGSDAVRRWESECIAYAAQLGEKAGGGDGGSESSPEERGE